MKRPSSLRILDIQIDILSQIYSLHSSNNLPRTTLSSSRSSNRFTTVTRGRRQGPAKKGYGIYSRGSSKISRKQISSTHWTKFPMIQGLISWRSICRFKQAGEACSSPHVHCKCLSPFFQIRCTLTRIIRLHRIRCLQTVFFGAICKTAHVYYHQVYRLFHHLVLYRPLDRAGLQKFLVRHPLLSFESLLWRRWLASCCDRLSCPMGHLSLLSLY